MNEWLPPPRPLDLRSDQVHVWRIQLSSIPLNEDALSEAERQRAARFHFDKDRDRYIVSHASLRDILSRYLQSEPHDLKFAANEFGKPFLPDHNIEFNLSHSGDLGLIAVTRGRKVGVDIELIREDIELENLAARFFSPREISELMALTIEQRTRGFFNCWARKEAYIKAHGLGLSLPLDSFDVSLDERALLRATRPDADEASRWMMLSLDTNSGYAGAVAVQGNNVDFKCWDWNRG